VLGDKPVAQLPNVGDVLHAVLTQGRHESAARVSVIVCGRLTEVISEGFAVLRPVQVLEQPIACASVGWYVNEAHFLSCLDPLTSVSDMLFQTVLPCRQEE
jgi:hypothetical protein